MKRKNVPMAVLLLSTVCYGPVADAANGQINQLDTIYVEGNRESGVMAGGNVARVVSVGPLGQTDFMDAPANVISYTDQLIHQNFIPTRTFLNAMTNNPSVMVGGASTDNNVELQIRGLPFNTHDILLDGLPGMMMMENETTNWADRIEVMTGPNAVISGMGLQQSVSGMINFVPKKAQDVPNFDLTETFSEKRLFTHTIDLGRRFGENNRYGIRINAEAFNGDTSVSREDMKGKDLYVNLDQRTENSKSSILIGYESSIHYGMPEILKISDSVWGDTVTHLPSAEKVQDNFMPSWSEMEHRKNVYMMTHEQKLNEHVTAYVKAGYMKRYWPGYLGSKPNLLNDAGDFTYTIDAGSTKGNTTRRSLMTGLNIRFETGSIAHQLNVGYDYMSQYSYNSFSKGDSVTINGNIYEPLVTDTVRPSTPTGFYYLGGKTNLKSFVLTDSIEALNGKLKLVAGLRHQAIETRSYNKEGVQNTAKHYNKSANTPAFGVLYKVTPRMSVYANYAEALTTLGSVSMTEGYKNGGEVLAPVKTKQYEWGSKWDLGQWATSISYFHIEQPQGMTRVLENGDKYYVVDAETRSQGVEWNIFGQPLPKLSVTGGVMWLDAEYTKTQGGLKNGNKVYGTPRFNATLALGWETPVEGLTVNGRILYFGDSYAESNNRINVPSWTRLDLGAQYDAQIWQVPMTFSVMAYNVTDKKYWSTTTTKYGETGLMLNPGRTYIVSAAVHF